MSALEEVTLSHSALESAHAEELAALAQRKAVEVRKGQAAIAAATDGYESAALDVTSRFKAEKERRLIAYQRWVAEQLADPVAAFEASPDRATAKAFVASIASLDAEAIARVGRTVSDWELGHAFIAHRIRCNPESFPRLALPQNWSGISRDSIAELSGAAMNALRLGATGDVLARLQNLEEQVGRVGAMVGVPSCDDAAERFEVARFSGSSEATAAALLRLDKAAHEKKFGTTAEIVARANQSAQQRDAALNARRPGTFIGAAKNAVTNLLFGTQDNPSGLPQAAPAAPPVATPKASVEQADAPPPVAPVAFV